MSTLVDPRAHLATGAATGLPARGRSVSRDRTLLAIGSTLVYLSVMAVLSSRDLLFTDGVSRVANGYYALASRDPHLAAIGFVWNPLPSILSLPLLCLAPLWRPLASLGLAGSIPVAIAGGVTVAVLHTALQRLGVGRWLTLALSVLYALHPYIVLAAASGTSETLMLLWLVLSTSALIRWVSHDEPMSLVMAGSALALAYLTRYEALAAAIGVGAGVALVSALRNRQKRFPYILNDLIIVLLPTAYAFALWAVASKLIVDQWFAQFSSSYGNSSQVSFASDAIAKLGTGPLGRVGYALTQASALQPLLVALLLLAAWVSIRKARLDAAVPIAVFAAVLAFQWATLAMGGSFGFLRYAVSGIPLAVLCGGAVLSSLRGSARIARALIVAALCVAIPSSIWVLGQPTLAREESLMSLSGRAGQHSMEREIAKWLDAHGLPEGSVLTDVAYSGPIVVASSDPRQFVITTDRDFAAILADPKTHGVRYVLVTKHEVSPADAVERQYPGMYASGGGIATPVKEWRDARDYTWRLFQLK